MSDNDTFRVKNLEMDFNYLCEVEYKRILLLMAEVEKQFDIDLRDYRELRHKFLDVANFIRKLPSIREGD